MNNRKIKHWMLINVYLLIYDVFVVNFAYIFALWIRFDCRYSTIDNEYILAWLKFAPIYTVVCVVVFCFFRLYQSIWRFASYNELSRIILSSLITFCFHAVGITILFQRMPITYYMFGGVIQFFMVLGIRFSYRFVLLERSKREQKQDNRSNAMLIGAGAAGQMILRDINIAKETSDRICCIIDDNPNKWNRYIDGIPVVGGRDEILATVKKYNIKKIFLAIPSISAAEKRDILNICNETDCELKNLPGMYQFVNGDIKASALKEVSVEDLLGREPISVNLDEIFDYLKDKVILITGGGGSIGSELVRQIASHHPRQLIIFDVYENNAYDIQQEIKKKYQWLDLVVLIGSVRDSRRLEYIFDKYRPNVVYHAAAHKHVPLMEDSPCEAIKNNVLGTYKTAYMSMKYNVERFVLISTDKAVNPTNVMGASKRLCEMIIQTFDHMIKNGKVDEIRELYTHEDINQIGECDERIVSDGCTEFVAVRFGNVLGSNGSVIPLFKKQIAQGGPVTVTHPDIIRYFMTIPEAVGLVLQASVYAKGGEIFVLDMGEPMKIDSLARNLIKLSGYKPDVDIKIEYTGLRPGEKMYEEKLMAEEGMDSTPNRLIHIGKPIEFEHDQFIENIQKLMNMAYDNSDCIRDMIRQVVETYIS